MGAELMCLIHRGYGERDRPACQQDPEHQAVEREPGEPPDRGASPVPSRSLSRGSGPDYCSEWRDAGS